MARFYGVIGYVHEVEDGTSGNWLQIPTEYHYYGDILRDVVQSRENLQQVHNEINISNYISIMADAYAYENYHAMKYIMWDGVRWNIREVEERRPRLLIRLGGLYNGITPDSTG